jgi:D-xylose transport system ATP-binding protein
VSDSAAASKSDDPGLTGTPPSPLVELRRVSKYFGGVAALNSVDFRVHPNEVVALVGDNGAGKSTLLKILSGIEPPESGDYLFAGELVTVRRPRDATGLGIQTVYQDLALCDNLNAVQNLFLGQEKRGSALSGWRLDNVSMEARTTQLLTELGISTITSLHAPVRDFSGGQRQILAVCRSLLWDPRVVLLDEPTAALGVIQRRHVIDLINRLRSPKRGIVIVSHDLSDVVMALTDRIVVLRLGQVVANFRTQDVNVDAVVAAITGATVAAARNSV